MMPPLGELAVGRGHADRRLGADAVGLRPLSRPHAVLVLKERSHGTPDGRERLGGVPGVAGARAPRTHLADRRPDRRRTQRCHRACATSPSTCAKATGSASWATTVPANRRCSACWRGLSPDPWPRHLRRSYIHSVQRDARPQPGRHRAREYHHLRTAPRLSWRHISSKMDEIVDFAELGDYIDLPVRIYSTGMMTRLGFSIATAVEPEILLLDEGLATGDAQFAQKAERKLNDLIARSSILVIASHSETLLANMCNRCLLLEHGRIISGWSGPDAVGDLPRLGRLRPRGRTILTACIGPTRWRQTSRGAARSRPSIGGAGSALRAEDRTRRRRHVAALRQRSCNAGQGHRARHRGAHDARRPLR